MKQFVVCGGLLSFLVACSGGVGEEAPEIRSLNQSALLPDCLPQLEAARADVSAAKDQVAIAREEVAAATLERENAATPQELGLARQRLTAARQALTAAKAVLAAARQALAEVKSECLASGCTPSFEGLGGTDYILRADGTVVGGLRDVSDDGSIGITLSSVWTPAGSTPLASYFDDEPADSQNILARGLNADGSVIVGSVTLPKPPYGATPQLYRWTETGGFEVVPQPFEDWEYFLYYTSAVDVSADGETLVGYTYLLPDPSYAYRYPDAFLWTPAGGYEFIGKPSGFDNAWPSALSHDGSTVVGSGKMDEVYSYDEYALIWDEASGWTNLGLGGLNDVSGDGSVAVGYLEDPDPDTTIERASVWDWAGGHRLIETELAAAGVSTSGWVLRSAHSISEDGKLVVGTGTNPTGQTEAWLACLP